MAKLWQKDDDLDELIETFTVGEDYILDRHLVVADCVASMAHARMLQSIGILSSSELDGLLGGLRDILKKASEGSFSIDRSDEDSHTAIENTLTNGIGEAGKKIHTGRSRNDQVIAALRLYLRSYLFEFAEAGSALVDTLLRFAQAHSRVPMPGRTHMQQAMLSSVGLWAGSFAEEILANLILSEPVYDLVNQSPLGSAASYGVPLALDRELVADLLGFERVQNNVLYVNNSRGIIESWVLELCDHLGISLSRLAQDLMFFTLPEIGYFSLAPELCTGSSIMPQKKNPDLLELVRARSATLSGYARQLKDVVRGLPSGYNKDLQETKEPIIRGFQLTLGCVSVMIRAIETLEVHENRLREGIDPEIFATDSALDLVAEGASFREAYRQVAKELSSLDTRDLEEAMSKRISTGNLNNLGLDAARTQLDQYRERMRARSSIIKQRIGDLVGFTVNLY